MKANLPQVDRENLKADGWTDEDIDAITLYCEQANAAGHFDLTAWPIMSPHGEIRIVCKTVALAVRRVRPDLPEVVIKQ